MKRRTVLKMAVTAPMVPTLPSQSAVAATEDDLTTVSKNFFSPLRNKEAKQEAVVECANAFCETQKALSQETLTEITDSGESTDIALRRIRFGVRILTEYGITNAIDESMVSAGEQSVSKYTRYVPLVGSFNNCREAACALDEDKPETIKQFLYAAFAFGAEAVMWSVGAPYAMAWRGTRFISNRTFLRLAKNGCSGCVAFAMSEIHWAIRGTIYNADEVVTEDKIQFVTTELAQLQQYANEQGYEIELETRRTQIKSLLGEASDNIAGGGAILPQESQGPFERLLPNIDFQLELPDLSIDEFI